MSFYSEDTWNNAPPRADGMSHAQIFGYLLQSAIPVRMQVAKYRVLSYLLEWFVFRMLSLSHLKCWAGCYVNVTLENIPKMID